MEKINTIKRNLLKRNLIIGSLIGIFSAAPVTAFNLLEKKSEDEKKEKIIKNEDGRIIKIINSQGEYIFETNPMEYKLKNA